MTSERPVRIVHIDPDGFEDVTIERSTLATELGSIEFETVDTAGEAIADEVEAEATAYIEEIRDMGDGSVRDGVLRGIEEGYFHREIQEASYEYQERVDSGEETVVGVNAYRVEEDAETDLLRVDETTRERQLDRLESVKAERDDDAVEAALDEVRAAVDGDENAMPAIVAAVKEYATMGEIMAVFEAEHGTYRERIGVA